MTHQAFRRSSSTHMQSHATVKDMQRHLRHTDPQTTLRHYAKVIPESLRAAVTALDAQISGEQANAESPANCESAGIRKGRASHSGDSPSESSA